MIISAELLLELGCCGPEVIRFRWRWPSGMEVTAENVLVAHGLGFDVGWLPRFARPELERRFLREFGYLGEDPWRCDPWAAAQLCVTLAECVEGPFPWPNDTAAARWRKSLD